MSDLRYMKTTGDVSLDRLLLELQSRIATLERASATPPASASTASVAVSNGGGAYKSVTLLGDLSDVSIASPAANNGLVWSGTYWINNPVVLSLNGATGVTTVQAGTGLSRSVVAGDTTLANTGVLSVVAGTGIGSTGGQNPSISNTGVLSVNGITGAVLTAVDGYIKQSIAGQTTTYSVPMWKRGDL